MAKKKAAGSGKTAGEKAPAAPESPPKTEAAASSAVGSKTARRRKRKPVATKRGKPAAKAKRRGPGRPKGSKNRPGPRPAPKRAVRKAGRARRYTSAERAQILAAARREKLTGAQVAKRFGVSTVTYYAWRKQSGGAKRPKRGRRPGRPTATVSTDLVEQVRRELRAQIGRILPDIIRSEVGLAIGGASRRRR